MADIRPPARQPLTSVPAQPRPVDGNGQGGAARTAAQRAFFQAALGAQGSAAATPSVPAPSAPVRAAAAPAAPTATPAQTIRREAPMAPSEPQRYLRPGSLLDIKV